MSLIIWPSANDVSPSAGLGKVFTERAFASLLSTLIGQNFVVSGFTMPSSDADLTIPVSDGFAMIAGRLVNFTTSTNVVCTANNTNYIWLQLTTDISGNADGATISASLSGTNPGNAVGLGVAIAGTSSISSITDTRFLAGVVNHNHSSNSSGKGGQLNGNAVGGYDATMSVSVSASTSASTASVSHSNKGTGLAVITATCHAAISVAGAAEAEMVIRRNGTVIGNTALVKEGLCALTIVDNPNPGAATSYTYDVAFRRTAGGTATEFTATSIFLTVMSVV